MGAAPSRSTNRTKDTMVKPLPGSDRAVLRPPRRLTDLAVGLGSVGLAVGSDGSVHVTWTGLNRFALAPQTDFYTGAAHDGFAQDAMYARR
jgi:hypothetical protein